MTTLGEVFGANGRARTSEPNPFKRDEQGKIPSVTAISTLCRENPLRAVQMCKAAGENLDKWFPNNPK